MTLEFLCQEAVKTGASDLILHEGRSAILRCSGSIHSLDIPVTPGILTDLITLVGAPEGAQDFDGALVFADGTRFRVNVLRQLGVRAAVLRTIRRDIPDLQSLGLPDPITHDWLTRKSGIILVTGPTGAGKTTTMAAMLDWINASTHKHIVTIEDPVEFVFTDKASIFTQREVGIDTTDYAKGLRQALRQSPDIIFIGEIRDSQSAETALRAAETGHLIFATVHGASAKDAIERLTQLLPESDRSVLGRIFAGQLIGVIAQRLVPDVNGAAVLAAESFTNVGATRRFIEEGRLDDLADFIERTDNETAVSLLQSFVALCRNGRVTEEVAAANVPRPGDLQRLLRGFQNQPSRR